MSANTYTPITQDELKKLLGPAAGEKQVAAAQKTINLYNTVIPELNAILDLVADSMYNLEKLSPEGVVEGLKKYDISVHGRIATARNDTKGDSLIGPVYKRDLSDYSNRLTIAKNEALPFIWYMQNKVIRDSLKLAQAQKNIAAGLKASKSRQKSLQELLKELNNIGA